jgi:hypothetical protein
MTHEEAIKHCAAVLNTLGSVIEAVAQLREGAAGIGNKLAKLSKLYEDGAPLPSASELSEGYRIHADLLFAISTSSNNAHELLVEIERAALAIATYVQLDVGTA